MRTLLGFVTNTFRRSYSVGVRWTARPPTETSRRCRSTLRSPLLMRGSAPVAGRATWRRATRIRASSSSMPNGFVM